ncbi:MAG: MIP/aquaporin family protein, partial [Vicinamibacteria bacterium]
ACLFATLFEHPLSPIRQTLADPFVRRVLMGIAMGLTAVTIIYSPWGKQSGAHINPAVTLTFYRLKKLDRRDAAFYVLAQFAGASLGVAVSALLLRGLLGAPEVNYVVTTPGLGGVGAAFWAEVGISFGLMTVVLFATNHPKLARFTGLFAGALVATYISLEAPISGMSMNPARSFGSAAVAWLWNAHWIYFTAPPIGMLLAAEIYLRVRGAHSILCAKLHHQNDRRCIFHCGYS